MKRNPLGQAIGDPVLDWRAPPVPRAVALEGRHGRIVPLERRHAAALCAAFAADEEGRMWTYLPYGPLHAVADVETLIGELSERDDTDRSTGSGSVGSGGGVSGTVRIAAAGGSIEVGNVCYAPRLQRTPLATEVMFLMMSHAFELGYRRYEWKCDALNDASRRAALRLGFDFEGIFRQATIYKGRNRDTAWYAILDVDWPRVRDAMAAWLHPDNFDEAGQQRHPLAYFRKSA